MTRTIFFRPKRRSVLLLTLVPVLGVVLWPTWFNHLGVRLRGQLQLDGTQTIVVNNVSREYLVHVPTTYRRVGTTVYPLLLVFHGSRMTPADMAELTQFNTLADRYGFIVVYPAGIDQRWNDGRETAVERESTVDDVAFVRALIARLQRDLRINTTRMYATGASNGGMLVHRLGCEMADTLAGIAPVISALPNNLATCTPARPISVLTIQGTADSYIPFIGGVEGWQSGLGDGGQLESAAATIQAWATKNSCTNKPQVTTLPTRVKDGTAVTQQTYPGCAAATQVSAVFIEGGGHTWPPSQPRPLLQRTLKLGTSSRNLNASQVIVDFFHLTK